MPASHKSYSQNVSKSAILVLEGYDALAAAICSALKKFAPHQSTVVAHSVDEAEKLAVKSKPALFIIDFDPSFPGLAGFLEKMRKMLADARALILAGRIPTEVADEFRAFGTLQFMQKPYDVAAFGAAVQTLLVPAGLTESQRTLRRLGLADIIALECIGVRTAILDVKKTTGDQGSIQIVNGHIVHAETGEQSGLKALTEMFKWSSPRVRETAQRLAAARTIQSPWAPVLLSAWRPTHPETGKEKEPRAKTGKKIVVIDDTEMLLVFVEDVLSNAGLGLQITKALTGTEGIRETERVLPDLVLVDYSLPDINGDEICRRLLANEQTAHIPVLMMSGHVAEMNAAAAKLQNIVATIEKPFLSEPFVELVRQTLATGSRLVAAPRPRPTAPLSSPPPVTEKLEEPVAVQATSVTPLPASSPTPTTVVSPAPAIEPQKAEAPPMVSFAHVPAEFARPYPADTVTIPAPIISSGEAEVVLRIFVEVLSMQLTPRLRMGAIRARLASPTVSLHFLSSVAPGVLPETGFQLGATESDQKGCLTTLHLIPTAKPFQHAVTRSEFEIGGVALVAGDQRSRVQLTPAGTTPMTMELSARLTLGRVALSPTFQVAYLVLKWHSSLVRVTLDPKTPQQSGAVFNLSIRLDTFGRISELLLNPPN